MIENFESLKKISFSFYILSFVNSYQSNVLPKTFKSIQIPKQTVQPGQDPSQQAVPLISVWDFIHAKHMHNNKFLRIFTDL